MLLLSRLLLIGCALLSGRPTQGRPPPMLDEPPIPVRGPTERCRVSYVFAGPVAAGAPADGHFRQFSGTLDGAGFGSCTLMGPTEEGEWLWVLMSFERGFRGELSCWVGKQRSPTLLVVADDGPLPEDFKVKYLFMDPELEEGRVLPSESAPCPDLDATPVPDAPPALPSP